MLSKMLTMRHIEAQRTECEAAPEGSRHRGKAGLSCAVTIATNMAGRGTDIAEPEVKAAGGLAIIGTGVTNRAV